MRKKFSLIVTVEDNAVKGGAGSLVNEIIIKENIENISIINIGAPDKFFCVIYNNFFINRFNKSHIY